MLRVLIVEDDYYDRQRCNDYVSNMVDDVVVDIAKDGAGALLLLENHIYDVAFIDIELPDINGFKLVDKIRGIEVHELLDIVFITGTDNDKLEVHRKYHYYEYIRKPYNEQEFVKSLGGFLKALDKRNEKYIRKEKQKIFIYENRQDVKILEFDEILFAEKEKKKVLVFLGNGEQISTLLTMDELVSCINNDRFIRCHRSFAVNLDKIRGLAQRSRSLWEAEFKNKKLTCEISARYIEEVNEKRGRNA